MPLLKVMEIGGDGTLTFMDLTRTLMHDHPDWLEAIDTFIDYTENKDQYEKIGAEENRKTRKNKSRSKQKA